jgi:aldehyde:ferredoxin oxidoreductase
MSLLGRILEIDLSAGKWRYQPYPDDLLWKYLSGRGFNVQYLYNHMPADTDPLGPDNILIFSCGLLTGTAAPASARLHVNARSPLTGLLGSSNIGGNFGVKLRSCGIQTIIIRGKSPEPVYLSLDGDKIEIRNARFIWGLDTWETDDYIKNRLGSNKLEIMTIGPAGENGTLFGCIMTDRDHAAGRTGMGTVMGSKNLKAIVVKAPKKKAMFRTDENGREAIKRYIWQMKHSPHYKDVKKHGGAGYVEWADDLGILATRNFKENTFEAAGKIDGKNLEKNIIRKHGCYRCPVQCKADLSFTEGKLKGRKVIRPEFEPMLSLGSRCGLTDLETLVYLDNLCSRLGMDSISAGGAIAFAMDLFDRGILTKEDTDGLELAWGNGEAMEVLIKQMVAGEGLGGILAKGVRKAARIIGRGAEYHAPHVKGLEIAGYHPDNIMGTALGYTVSNRGADFSDVYATLEYKWLPDEKIEEFGLPKTIDLNSIEGKAALVRQCMIVGMVMDCLGLCKVPSLCLICNYDLVAEAELASELTGQAVSVGDLFYAGERILNLERLLNGRFGSTGAEDRLPDMFFDREYNAGQQPSKPQEWMQPMIQEFYTVMGWNENGRPTEEKLAQLGLIPSRSISDSAA